jgi:hypothetical protein
MLAHQSDREYHCAYFPDGVSSNTKKQGHEQRNVLLLILVYLCSDEGAELEDSTGQARLSLSVLLISHMLLLKHFFWSSSISAKQLKLFGRYIPMLLAVYKFALNCSTGNGLKISKFHFGVHAKDDIDRFGHPCS